MFCASLSWLHASSWDTCKYRRFVVKQVGDFWAVMKWVTFCIDSDELYWFDLVSANFVVLQ